MANYLTSIARDDNTSIFPVRNDFVRFNVSGMVYETLRSTLERYPATLLGDKQRCQKYFAPSKDAYFFDRHKSCFEAILYYYQSNGVLARPLNIPDNVFQEEILFFGLDAGHASHEAGMTEMTLEEPETNGGNTWKQKIWNLFEVPESSIGAKVLAGVSILMIVLSIVAYCMETMPDEREIMGSENPSGKRKEPWNTIELICIIWFSFEYSVRFASSPHKIQFLKSFINFIDILAIIPYFISAAIYSEKVTGLSAIRALRIIRVFRVLKLSRHSDSLKVLGATLRASIHEILILSFFITVTLILFSSGIFYAEFGVNPTISSIPDTFWFSLTSMKTVGYGDQVPVTVIGKLIGALCTISGVLAITLPMPIIMTNFRHFHNQIIGKRVDDVDDDADNIRAQKTDFGDSSSAEPSFDIPSKTYSA